MHDVSIGRLLADTLRVWLRNLPAYLLLATMLFTPYVVYVHFVQVGAIPLREEAQLGISLALSLLLGGVLSATTVHGVIGELHGLPLSLGRCLAGGLGRLAPVVGVSVLVTVAVGLGALAFVIPGLVLMCVFYVAIPVTVVERVGVLASLGRSRALTRGHRVPIFGSMLLVLAIGTVTSALVDGLFADGSRLELWAIFVHQLVAASFGAVLSGVVYDALRRVAPAQATSG